jgi:hypothetical protein
VTGFRLDEDQRKELGSCLQAAQISLRAAEFQKLVQVIEDTIERFRDAKAEGTFREARGELRKLWQLSHDDDPSVAALRARLVALPKEAIEQVGSRSRVVIPELFPGVTIGDEPFDPPQRLAARFLEWAAAAEGTKLVTALRVLSEEGARITKGRSRGGGKRSRLRLEPLILGKVRGTGTRNHTGGRPTEIRRHELVMHLALDWLLATGQEPEANRSDLGGFSSLVHRVFEWLQIDDADSAGEAATYALRRYWAAVAGHKARSSLRNFLRRHGEEP